MLRGDLATGVLYLFGFGQKGGNERGASIVLGAECDSSIPPPSFAQPRLSPLGDHAASNQRQATVGESVQILDLPVFTEKTGLTGVQK